MRSGGICVLSSEPLVMATYDSFVPALLDILPATLLKRSFFLVFSSWTKEPWSKAVATSWRLNRIPRKRAVFMCSTFRETSRMNIVGFKSAFCHHNLFCNEDDYMTSSGEERRFDAVYTAVAHGYKRHHLSAKVRSLYLLISNLDRLSFLAQSYDVIPPHNDRILTAREISAVYGDCKTGLALSAVEGGMRAATEYLLCGLPIVSTPSLGGRDAYYDRNNHIICGESPDAVADSVALAVSRDWDRALIRANAIKRSQEFRQTLSDTVRSITGTAPFSAESISGSWFADRFVSGPFLSDYFAQLSQR